MKLATLSAALFFHSITYGQTILYKQSNKISEYNYGVVDTAGMNKLSESEKIKYELKVVEKTYTKKIFDTYDSEMEVKIDSNEYEQSWMSLARRYTFNSNGMEWYDAGNQLIGSTNYNEEQLKTRSEEKEEVKNNGYHPGILAFPEYNSAAIAELAKQNIIVTLMPGGEYRVKSEKETTTYDLAKKTIQYEYTDKDGFKCKETLGYEPYGNNNGYLLRIHKWERSVLSNRGACITETKLLHYNNYSIQDEGGLMAKAGDQLENITVYPNPTDGVFTAKVLLAPNHSISSVKVVNLVNGTIVPVDANGQTTFLVNLPNIPPGNYALQVLTSAQKLLSVNFIKL